jgi:hypothetical protein
MKSVLAVLALACVAHSMPHQTRNLDLNNRNILKRDSELILGLYSNDDCSQLINIYSSNDVNFRQCYDAPSGVQSLALLSGVSDDCDDPRGSPYNAWILYEEGNCAGEQAVFGVCKPLGCLKCSDGADAQSCDKMAYTVTSLAPGTISPPK